MLAFKTPGKADLRALLTMGVSVKEHENSIGMFGTGFKYAVATILRNHGSVSIVIDGERKVFSTKKDEVRGKEFHFIYLNDEPLHITTHLGKNWEMWMAYRELRSNTIDERGEVLINNHEIDPAYTYIVVDGLDEQHVKRNEIFLHERKPIYANDAFEIYAGATDNYYYQGVIVGKLSSKFQYTYNLKRGCVLTEDRTVQYWNFQYQLAAYIVKITDPIICETIVSAREGMNEYKLDFDTGDWSEQFTAAVANVVHDLKSNGSLRDRWRKTNPDSFHESYQPSKFELIKVERAQNFLLKMGHDTTHYEYRYVQSLGEGIMGAAINGRIYIAQTTLKMGLKQITATIFEEYLHIAFELVDYTATMQNRLIEMLLEEAEQRLNEPL